MGNFSRDPQLVLDEALNLRYTDVRIEQGVPVLDRDLNLQVDLPIGVMRAALTRFLGSGVASSSSAFQINSGAPDNDFIIGPGSILVFGVEAVLGAPTQYSSQTGLPRLNTPTAVR